MRLVIRYLLVAACLAGCAVAAGWAVLVAAADLSYSKETLAGTEKAIRLAPGNASSYVRLAFFVSESQPKRAADALRRAIALNPLDSKSRIELGLLAESEQDYASAERFLLEAAAHDHLYLPAWSLANFYFRRDNREEFWKWAKVAAARIYGDPLPLFRMCGLVQEDGRLLDRLAIHNPSVESAYVRYLIAEGRVDLIAPSAARLIDSHQQRDVPALLEACEKLIQSARLAEAMNLWNSLARNKMMPQPEIDPAAGTLFDDRFTSAPLSVGFDWRLRPLEGVSVSQMDNDGGLRFSFSGRQPENCEPMYRLLPLEQGRRYKLTWRSSTSEVPADAGLYWRIFDLGSSALLGEVPIAGGETEREGSTEFSTTPGSRLVLVGLECRRVLGRTRIEGALALASVQLTRLSAPTLTKGGPAAAK